MGYCFMRIDNKMKSASAMDGAYKHNYRITEVSNADPDKQYLNEELISLNGKTYAQAFEDRIKSLEYYQAGNKYRKDAVRAFEVVTTFSKEDFEHVDIEAWKKDNVEWLNKTFNANERAYGNNVASVMYHGDETGNVHCHALIIPIDAKGHLNANYYLGGREKYREMQNTYGKMMEERHGLKRGLAGSKASHKDIARFYTELNTRLSIDKSLEPQAGETLDEYAERVIERIKDMEGAHMRELKKQERALMVKRTKHKDPALKDEIKAENQQKELRKLKKERTELERDFGSMKLIRQKLTTTDRLQDAIRNYPDERFAMETLNGMNKLMAWQREEDEKKKDRKKINFIQEDRN